MLHWKSMTASVRSNSQAAPHPQSHGNLNPLLFTPVTVHVAGKFGK